MKDYHQCISNRTCEDDWWAIKKINEKPYCLNISEEKNEDGEELFKWNNCMSA